MHNTLLHIALAIFLPSIADAAQISYSDKTGMRISGRIEPGDSERYIKVWLESGGPKVVHLADLEGDFQEAAKIAEVVERTWTMAGVPEKATCSGSCLLILLSARSPGTYDSKTSRLLASSPAQPALANLVHRRLLDIGVSDEIIYAVANGTERKPLPLEAHVFREGKQKWTSVANQVKVVATCGGIPTPLSELLGEARRNGRLQRPDSADLEKIDSALSKLTSCADTVEWEERAKVTKELERGWRPTGLR